jgi:hypothetical protein
MPSYVEILDNNYSKLFVSGFGLLQEDLTLFFFALTTVRVAHEITHIISIIYNPNRSYIIIFVTQ